MKGGREATGPRRGRVGRARGDHRRRRAPRHLDRPRRDAVGLRHRAAPRDHVAGLGPGDRIGRCGGAGRLRRRGRRRRCRTPCSRLRSSTGGSTRSPRSRTRWPAAGLSVRRARSVIDPAAVRFGRGRPRAGDRARRLRRRGPDAGVDGPRGTRRDHRDGRRPLPLAVPRPPLAQGRDERQRPAGRRHGGRLRRRRPARERGPGRPDLPPRDAVAASTPRRRQGRRQRSPTPRDSPGSRPSGRRSPSEPRRGRRARTPRVCSRAASTRRPARSPRRPPRS